jgi:hypothetical protein
LIIIYHHPLLQVVRAAAGCYGFVSCGEARCGWGMGWLLK